MTDAQYFAIPLATLTADRPLRFDIYVPVGPRFVNYMRRGLEVDEERLQRLHQKNVGEVFIHVLDRLAYESFLAEDADRAFRGEGSLRERAEVIVAYQQSSSARYMENVADADLYRQLRATAARVADFLAAEPFAVGQILAAPKHLVSVTRHSANVATLATVMLQRQPPAPGTPVSLLTLGCLLHDIDHFRAGRDLSRGPATLSAEERREYEDHPIRGAQLASDAPFMDQLVVSIISQHEEMPDGSGYPRKLKEDRMEPLVLLAGAANAYDRLVSFEGLPPRDALKSLLIDKMGQYPLEHLTLLQTVLKLAEVV